METTGIPQAVANEEINQEHVDKFWEAFGQLTQEERKVLMYREWHWSGESEHWTETDDLLIKSAESKLNQAGFNIKKLGELMDYDTKISKIREETMNKLPELNS